MICSEALVDNIEKGISHAKARRDGCCYDSDGWFN